MNQYLKAFKQQKRSAEKRGIEFKLTFQQWRDFWGDDIDRRGRGAGQLGMHRIADSGAYELSNIVKGTPRQNSATYSAVRATARAHRAHAAHQRKLDALIAEQSRPDDDEIEDPYETQCFGIRSSMDHPFNLHA